MLETSISLGDGKETTRDHAIATVETARPAVAASVILVQLEYRIK